jgi:hypothetical protein
VPLLRVVAVSAFFSVVPVWTPVSRRAESVVPKPLLPSRRVARPVVAFSVASPLFDVPFPTLTTPPASRLVPNPA